MVIQCKNLISLYILPDQRRVNLRYFDFDQNRLWGATSLYLFSFSLHFTRLTTGKSIFIFLLFTFYQINDGWKSASSLYMYSFCNLLFLFCHEHFIRQSKICLEFKLGFISLLFFLQKTFFFALRFVAHTPLLTSQWLITCLC